MSISPAIAALIERMDEHPDEFLDSRWDPITNRIDPYEGTRWSEITTELDPTHKDTWFTPEEIATYNDKLKALYRSRVESSIIKELLTSEHADRLAGAQTYREMQLSLPFGTSMMNATQPRSVINVTGQDRIMADALKIIRGQTP